MRSVTNMVGTGYYLNVTARKPSVFVLWRMEGVEALPVQVTASSDEAARWLDGGHSLDAVPMPAEIYAWVGEYVEQNYRPKMFGGAMIGLAFAAMKAQNFK